MLKRAVINGTEARTIQEIVAKISIQKRSAVKEVSMDMARNMGLSVENSFPNSTMVIDRFHVVRLVMDAMHIYGLVYDGKLIVDLEVALFYQ